MTDAARCVCGHPLVSHNIGRTGTRTRCLTATGPAGAPCDCRRYTPANPPPSSTRSDPP